MAISGESTIYKTTVGQTSKVVCPENGNRIGLMISVSHPNNPADITASAWVQFKPAGDNAKTGILIRTTAPFPFCMMPATVYYGEVSAVSATQNDVVVHVTEY